MLFIRIYLSLLLLTCTGSLLSAQDEKKITHYAELSFLGIHRLESGVSTFQRVPLPQFINYTIFYKSYGIGLDYSSHFINNHTHKTVGSFVVTDLNFLSLRISRAIKFGKRHRLEPLIRLTKRWGHEAYVSAIFENFYGPGLSHIRVEVVKVDDWGIDAGFRYRFNVYKGFSLNFSSTVSRYFPKSNKQNTFAASRWHLHNMIGVGYSFYLHSPG